MRLQLLIPSLLSLVACKPQAEDSAGEALSYYADVKAIVDTSCVSCHYEGGIAPFALETYEQISVVGGMVKQSVVDRTMPPWLATDDCNTYAHDWSLSDEEIETIAAWVDGGMPEGDPSQTPDFDVVERNTPRADVTLSMPEPYMPVQSPDDYRCFLIPWPDDEAYVTGIDVVPGNEEMVHHVIAYLLGEDEIGDYQKMDAAEDGPGYTCFGGPGGNELTTKLLGGWAPGGMPGELPHGTGIHLEPGDWIALQVHYNVPNDGIDVEPDVSVVNLQVDEAVERPAEVFFFADPSWVLSQTMDIPAGDSEVTHDISYTLQSDFSIHTANLHMHLLGQRARYEIRRSDGSEECLLEVDDWDFNWQMTYALDEPVQFEPGDSLHLECTFDNSADNQPIIDGEQVEPQDANWGDGTRDEMCLATMLISG